MLRCAPLCRARSQISWMMATEERLTLSGVIALLLARALHLKRAGAAQSHKTTG